MILITKKGKKNTSPRHDRDFLAAARQKKKGVDCHPWENTSIHSGSAHLWGVVGLLHKKRKWGNICMIATRLFTSHCSFSWGSPSLGGSPHPVNHIWPESPRIIFPTLFGAIILRCCILKIQYAYCPGISVCMVAYWKSRDFETPDFTCCRVGT